MGGMADSAFIARTIRVRVCTSDPLPPAKFWILVESDESLQSFQDRVKDVLRRQYGDLPMAQARHLVSYLDDFEIVGDFGRLVHDNDLVRVSVRIPETHGSESPKKRDTNEASLERDLMAEAHLAFDAIRMWLEKSQKNPRYEAKSIHSAPYEFRGS